MIGVRNRLPVAPGAQRLAARDRLLIAIGAALAAGGGLSVGTGTWLPIEAAGAGLALVLACTTFTTISATAPLFLFATFVMPATFAWPLVSVIFYGAVLVVAWMVIMGDEWTGWPPGVIALPVVPLLAYTVNHGSGLELVQALKPAVGFAGAAWLAITLARRDPRALDRFVRWLTWFSIAVALLAVYQYATNTWPIIEQLSRNGRFAGRSAGVFCHPIVLGSFAVTMVTLAWNRRDRLWELVIVANVASIVLSGARSAWVSLAVVIGAQIVTAPLRRGRQIDLVRAGFTAFLAVVAVAAAFTVAPGVVTAIEAHN